MALTTQDGIKRAANVVSDLGTTDVNANVSAGTSVEKFISPEAAILFNKAIVAKPLMVPEVCSIRVKNHEYRYRWVNRDGQGGRIYTQRRAQGFTNATNDDVEVQGGDVQAKDGEIRAGDLILMKIQADRYDAAIKANMTKAMVYGNARGFYTEGGSSDVMSDAVPSRKTISAEPGARTGLAKPFIPENADALVNDSISSGRVNETRAVIDELRAKKEK